LLRAPRPVADDRRRWAACCAAFTGFLRDVGGESEITASASGLGGGPDRCRLVGHGKLPILLSV